MKGEQANWRKGVQSRTLKIESAGFALPALIVRSFFELQVSL